ncbi:MAG: Gfo/Idh/MocA family protein [Verrucomicrobiales bacterium]
MITRRSFLATAGAALAAPVSHSQSFSPNSRLRVAVMGLGRGADHIKAWLAVPNVEIAGLCDVDSRRLAESAAAVERAGQSAKPKLVSDFRKLLEDREIDVLSIAAPNFWHGPAAILACQAGKHVYVEKPGSHTAQEGEWMVSAARKHGRHVQQGTQRRSLVAMREAIQRLKEGAIGPVRSARCWYDNSRSAVRLAPGANVPDWLDWPLWQGPAGGQPYLDGLVHYNWHWRWHYGGGELANNGVHALDLALWGLDECWSEKSGGPLVPRRVTCTGGRYHFRDDQETPDTQVAAFEFGPCAAFFDASSCHARKGVEAHPFVNFYGDGGSLALTGAGYKIFDLKGEKVAGEEPPFSDAPHFKNLADAIRDGGRLNCEIETGQRSTLLCHLGNIAIRTGSAITLAPETKKIVSNQAAAALWSKNYSPGWEPKV